MRNERTKFQLQSTDKKRLQSSKVSILTSKLSFESGICDKMTNCHLAESFLNLPMNDTPILSPYVPTRPPIVIQTNEALKGTFHQQHNTFLNQEYLRNVCYLNQSRSDEMMELSGSQHLFQSSLLRIQETKLCRNKSSLEPLNCCETKSTEHEERVKASIKFQDANKKMDFKINFHEEHRKANECFQRNDNKPQVDVTSSFAAPRPKKKWIRHYMTGNVIILISGVWRDGSFVMNWWFQSLLLSKNPKEVIRLRFVLKTWVQNPLNNLKWHEIRKSCHPFKSIPSTLVVVIIYFTTSTPCVIQLDH